MTKTSNEQFSRYKRQIDLPEIGIDGQKRLSKAKVLCVGAGGLGSPAILYLAAAGVGQIGIAEFDTVNEGNLHRQILYSMDDIGEPKLESAAKRIKDINPQVKIIPHCKKLNADNINEIIKKYDVVVECTDSFEAKNMICHAAWESGIDIVHGAVHGFRAQVAVFSRKHDAPCYRCLYPVSPKCKQDNAVMGAAAGIAGITQAMQVIMLIAPHKDMHPLIGKLWEIDVRTMQTRIIKVCKDTACDVCA